jgi:hypothetical protein
MPEPRDPAGGTCAVTTNGVTSTRTYDQLVDQERLGDWFVLGGGTILVVLGGLLFHRVSRSETPPGQLPSLMTP